MNTVRKAIESQYKGKCTIYEQKAVTDPLTHITSSKEVTVLENHPCKLSYTTVDSVEGEMTSSKIQIIKLFIAPEIAIKEGSKILITQNGVTREYSRSGVPAVFTNHQEIILELFKGYA